MGRPRAGGSAWPGAEEQSGALGALPGDPKSGRVQIACPVFRKIRGLYSGQQRYLGLGLDLGPIWAGESPSSTDGQKGQHPVRTMFCRLGSLGHKDPAARTRENPQSC